MRSAFDDYFEHHADRVFQVSSRIRYGHFRLSAMSILKLKHLGYGDAAVKLQRDWNVNAVALPFAKHIQGQALVKLVQKGLKYHHLQLTIDEVSASQDAKKSF